MAYDDTKWGGFAKIIVDTSTMQVGDKVRVKSMTTGTNYDKTVATVGTPLIWETDIYKDYVKICMVQTINDTPTEVGGVYKTIDYGQTLFIDNVFDLHTLQGIQGVLNAHNENYVLDIGDEVTIKINDGGTPKDWVMLIGGINIYDSHEVIFVSKYTLATPVLSYGAFGYDYRNSYARASARDFYSTIEQYDKQFIKTMLKEAYNYGSATTSYEDYTWLPNANEVVPNSINPSSYTITQHQFPIFTTQADRIKTDSQNHNAVKWLLSDMAHYSGANSYESCIFPDGSYYYYSTTTDYILPCFRLTADS